MRLFNIRVPLRPSRDAVREWDPASRRCVPASRAALLGQSSGPAGAETQVQHNISVHILGSLKAEERTQAPRLDLDPKVRQVRLEAGGGVLTPCPPPSSSSWKTCQVKNGDFFHGNGAISIADTLQTHRQLVAGRENCSTPPPAPPT